MAGGGVGELLRVRVEREAERGRHLVLVDVTQHPAQQLCRRRVLVGVRAEGVAELTHEHGRGDPVARDIAHGHGTIPSIGGRRRTSPRRLKAGGAGVVAADQLHALDLGKLLREQAALQSHCDLVLALERGRAVEGLRRLLGDQATWACSPSLSGCVCANSRQSAPSRLPPRVTSGVA